MVDGLHRSRILTQVLKILMKIEDHENDIGILFTFIWFRKRHAKIGNDFKWIYMLYQL